MAPTVLWFRRDLRLADHPALVAALGAAEGAVPLFVLDPVLQRTSGAPRLAFLHHCLAELHERTGGCLVLRSGDPLEVVPSVAEEVDAARVFATEDFGPYGRRRDTAVERALVAADRRLDLVGSPYAVTPGRLRKGDGEPFRVYTPWFRQWRAQASEAPVPEPKAPSWAHGVASEVVPPPPDLGATTILPPGELAARERLEAFLAGPVHDYDEGRDVPGDDATSRMSPYLKYGCIHPRTVLAGLGEGVGSESFRSEVAWREFYADLLFARPESASEELQEDMKALHHDEGPAADRRFEAWATGRTGYPMVDAGMRQLRADAWVHNRVRMIVASFLVKDLHLPWQRGAALFMERLQDGDLASNAHGWQWVAGTGTDPAPYFRVFNPVKQGRDHDPEGHYIRRYVPELADVSGRAVHEPWRLPGGPPNGYPSPIVDHAGERKEALARYAEVKGGPPGG